IKAEDGSPACVLPEDRPRLVESGWASRTIKSTEIYNSSSPQFGKYFEAGGVLFNVTSASLDLSNANNAKLGGVKVVVTMIVQSLREKPLYIDDSYFALEGISSDNKTITLLAGTDNYTKYFIPADHPVNITYSKSTHMKMAEFEGGWKYRLNIYLKPRNWHDWPGTVIP
ncbi:MAG: hypothetical protein KGI27_15810, partial [Thaumarchaeota archaeon]|nr:hypothetical protein [Nitrososphaerota archaeon]